MKIFAFSSSIKLCWQPCNFGTFNPRFFKFSLKKVVCPTEIYEISRMYGDESISKIRKKWIVPSKVFYIC